MKIELVANSHKLNSEPTDLQQCRMHRFSSVLVAMQHFPSNKVMKPMLHSSEVIRTIKEKVIKIWTFSIFTAPKGL